MEKLIAETDLNRRGDLYLRVNTTEIENLAAEAIREAETDLNRRGVLYIARARVLLDAVKGARLAMSQVAAKTPSRFPKRHLALRGGGACRPRIET